MDRNQKIFTTILWAVLVIAMLSVIGLRALETREQTREREVEALPTLFPAATFSLTDQNGATITDQSLRGNVYIVDFIFTHCAGPCPMMTSKMVEFQKRVTNPAIKLLSFSVDPERDTPPVLKEYADRFGADSSRWYFLTGEKSDIFDVAAQFKLTAKPADPNSDILHDERILLVDQAGQVRGIYHSKEAASMDKLAADASALANAGEGIRP